MVINAFWIGFGTAIGIEIILFAVIGGILVLLAKAMSDKS